jgi:hypothetical protein
MDHPSDKLLRRFLFASTTPQENQQIVRHLLARCPACAETLRKLQVPPPPAAYDRVLDRFASRLLEEASPGRPRAGRILAFRG